MKKSQDFKRPVARKLPSGSWFCRVRVDGKDIPVTKPTKKEAEAAAMAVKYGIIQAEEKPREKKITLEEAMTGYIEARDGYISPSTIAGYKRYRQNTFQSMLKKNIFCVSNEQWQAAIKAERKLGRSPKYI